MPFILLILNFAFLMHGSSLINNRLHHDEERPDRLVACLLLSLIIFVIYFLGDIGRIISYVITLMIGLAWWNTFSDKNPPKAKKFEGYKNQELYNDHSAFTNNDSELDDEDIISIMYDPINTEPRIIRLTDWEDDGKYISGLDVDDYYKEKTLLKERVIN